MSLTEEYLRSVCILNPSPWDDLRYMLRSPSYEELKLIPEEFDVIEVEDLPGPYPDQGQLPSCVGWSWSLWMRVTNLFLDDVPDILSAWDAYMKARKYDGLPDFLEGSNNLGAAKGLQKLGLCTEACWPTPTLKSQDPGQPCGDHENISQLFGIDSYYQVPITWGAFKSAMWGQISEPQWEGTVPLVVGYQVSESWREIGDDGIVPDPSPGDIILGGHSSLIVGIKLIDGNRYLVNLNSWGANQGDGGVFYIPESYLTTGRIMDCFIGRNGSLIENGESDCSVALGTTGLLNGISKTLGRKTRFKTYVDR